MKVSYCHSDNPKQVIRGSSCRIQQNPSLTVVSSHNYASWFCVHPSYTPLTSNVNVLNLVRNGHLSKWRHSQGFCLCLLFHFLRRKYIVNLRCSSVWDNICAHVKSIFKHYLSSPYTSEKCKCIVIWSVSIETKNSTLRIHRRICKECLCQMTFLLPHAFYP